MSEFVLFLVKLCRWSLLRFCVLLPSLLPFVRETLLIVQICIHPKHWYFLANWCLNVRWVKQCNLYPILAYLNPSLKNMLWRSSLFREVCNLMQLPSQVFTSTVWMFFNGVISKLFVNKKEKNEQYFATVVQNILQFYWPTVESPLSLPTL